MAACLTRTDRWLDPKISRLEVVGTLCGARLFCSLAAHGLNEGAYAGTGTLLGWSDILAGISLSPHPCSSTVHLEPGQVPLHPSPTPPSSTCFGQEVLFVVRMCPREAQALPGRRDWASSSKSSGNKTAILSALGRCCKEGTGYQCQKRASEPTVVCQVNIGDLQNFRDRPGMKQALPSILHLHTHRRALRNI